MSLDSRRDIGEASAPAGAPDGGLCGETLFDTGDHADQGDGTDCALKDAVS